MIYIFGHSHVHAFTSLAGERDDVEAYRLKVAKREKKYPSLPLPKFIDLAASGPEGSLIVSVAGGNHHSQIATIESLPPFHVEPQDGRVLIPQQVLKSHFKRTVNDVEGSILRKFRRRCDHQVVQLLAPPPKRSNGMLKTYFRERRGLDVEIAPAELRMQVYQLYRWAVVKACRKYKVRLLHPPKQALDEDGFLLPKYALEDSTHANIDYARLQLARLTKIHRKIGK